MTKVFMDGEAIEVPVEVATQEELAAALGVTKDWVAWLGKPEEVPEDSCCCAVLMSEQVCDELAKPGDANWTILGGKYSREDYQDRFRPGGWPGPWRPWGFTEGDHYRNVVLHPEFPVKS